MNKSFDLKNNTPRRKRLKRKSRLNSARSWINVYNGKNIIKGYSKWFGVDLRCAITELRMIGIEISKEYEENVRQSIKDRTQRKKELKEKKHEISLQEDTYVLDYTESFLLNDISELEKESNSLSINTTNEIQIITPEELPFWKY